MHLTPSNNVIGGGIPFTLVTAITADTIEQLVKLENVAIKLLPRLRQQQMASMEVWGKSGAIIDGTIGACYCEHGLKYTTLQSV